VIAIGRRLTAAEVMTSNRGIAGYYLGRRAPLHERNGRRGSSVGRAIV
jgi:hypothetical protein